MPKPRKSKSTSGCLFSSYNIKPPSSSYVGPAFLYEEQLGYSLLHNTKVIGISVFCTKILILVTQIK